MGLDRLLDLLTEGWDYITPFFIVNEYERGIILRFGKFSREIDPGLRWKWPLAEYCMTANTTITTAQTDAQILDDVAARLVVTYRINDVTKYLLNVGDDCDFLTDTAQVAVAKIMGVADLSTDAANAYVLKLLRKYVKGYGFSIRHVALVDFTSARTFRLINS